MDRYNLPAFWSMGPCTICIRLYWCCMLLVWFSITVFIILLSAICIKLKTMNEISKSVWLFAHEKSSFFGRFCLFRMNWMMWCWAYYFLGKKKLHQWWMKNEDWDGHGIKKSIRGIKCFYYSKLGRLTHRWIVSLPFIFS